MGCDALHAVTGHLQTGNVVAIKNIHVGATGEVGGCGGQGCIVALNSHRLMALTSASHQQKPETSHSSTQQHQPGDGGLVAPKYPVSAAFWACGGTSQLAALKTAAALNIRSSCRPACQINTAAGCVVLWCALFASASMLAF
jgi:hypothetical protein